MSSGSYSELEDAIRLLYDTVGRNVNCRKTKQESDQTTEPTLPPVTEATVVEQFGTSLRQVAEHREIRAPAVLVMSVKN